MSKSKATKEAENQGKLPDNWKLGPADVGIAQLAFCLSGSSALVFVCEWWFGGLTKAWNSTIPFLFLTCFFWALYACLLCHRRFSGTQRRVAVLIQTVVALSIIWTTFTYFALSAPVEVRRSQGDPNADAAPFAFLLPEPETLTTPDGDTIEGHRFQSEEEAAKHFFFLMPLIIGICFAPAFYFSAPFVQLFLTECTNASTLVRGVVYVAACSTLLFALVYWFTPEKVSSFGVGMFASAMCLIVAFLYVAVVTVSDARSFWVSVHLWGVLGVIAISVFVGHFLGGSGRNVLWGILANGTICALLFGHMLLGLYAPQLLGNIHTAKDVSIRVIVFAAAFAYVIYVFCWPSTESPSEPERVQPTHYPKNDPSEMFVPFNGSRTTIPPKTFRKTTSGTPNDVH